MNINFYETKFYEVVKKLFLDAQDALIDRRLDVIITQNDDGCILVIANNEIGISRENLRKIFDPFFFTKPAGTKSSSTGFARLGQIEMRNLS
jgi:signal transduction histidine kinase